ncbi:DNA repair protein RadA [Magnetospira thiophila]
MAKASHQYVCQQCGASYPKWAGKCEACGAWNSLSEEQAPESAPKGLGKGKGRRISFVELSGPMSNTARKTTGIAEFDRVCGGGLVPGSALLVGGDPGIGKSTLLLQVTAALSGDQSCAYISGEESVDQIRLRAARLGLSEANVQLAAATSVRDIVATLEGPDGPDVAIIDSIQTMYLDNLDSAPGTVGQVRASSHELIRLAKRRGITVVLVGHVTKEGAIAGPRVLEHMVDTVLYFEGDRGHQFRILRAVKNRFGATDEIGVFEMTERGLAEVPNPSALFLADHRDDVSGACVFAGLEGSRPVLVELQSLIAPSTMSTPRRAVVGWDSGRLSMLLAVMEARCGLSLSGHEVYLNVAGGLRIGEPAADLAVAAALASSVSGQPVPPGTVVFGEIGLSGEIRAVGRADARLKEAAKLGFTQAIIPKRRHRDGDAGPSGIALREVSHLDDLLRLFDNGASLSQGAGAV